MASRARRCQAGPRAKNEDESGEYDKPRGGSLETLVETIETAIGEAASAMRLSPVAGYFQWLVRYLRTVKAESEANEDSNEDASCELQKFDGMITMMIYN